MFISRRKSSVAINWSSSNLSKQSISFGLTWMLHLNNSCIVYKKFIITSYSIFYEIIANFSLLF